MSFTYCKSCGHKNLYSLNPPKFCGSCGQEMGGLSKALPNVNQILASKKKTQARDIDDQDGEDIFHVPEVKDFKCTFSAASDSGRKMSFSDLVPNLDKIMEQEKNNEEQKT